MSKIQIERKAMQLTKEQAIQEHRKMWNWIADQYDRGSNEHIGRLKELYFKNIYDGIINIPTGCFPCEYTRQNKDMISSYAYKCNECPLQWPVPENSSVVEEYCFDKYVYMDGMYFIMISMQKKLRFQMYLITVDIKKK